jgi:threonyl-tRNA synthetase
MVVCGGRNILVDGIHECIDFARVYLEQFLYNSAPYPTALPQVLINDFLRNDLMPNITLPDGSVRQFDATTNGAEIAASIGKSLARDAVALRVNGELFDLTRAIDSDVSIEIVTRESADGLELLRHDAAHVLAEAVKELWPDTQVTIGPAIENGFYYDFAREEAFTEEDLAVIEKRMQEIVDRDEAIQREVWQRDKAVDFFRSIGEEYKAEIIASIPSDQAISLYRQGEFIDLCRGPHLPSTSKLGKAFKLTRVSGAYWRGDSNNEMLQRVYGTAWANEKQLRKYLLMLEEAEKRDHRRLGKIMDLFHFQEEAPGAVFWHQKGWSLFQSLIGYMRERQDEAGFREINTPELMDRSLWEASGHWDAFGSNMYTTETVDGRQYAIKPMNCPGHIQVFKQGITSYRDLPYRLAEFGKCHRYEPSGALHGMMRVRAFTQDDAHIFVTPEQITDESIGVCSQLLSIYKAFGFEDVRIKFADRPEVRVGEDAIWDQAEAALLKALEVAGLDYTHNPGEGAFYGPKLEFVLRDAIGRDWQCGTLQVDLNMPGRLGASYIGDDGEKHLPVMLHRAIFGSLERFIGILIEHHAGNLPLWLAPTQVKVLTITSDADEYAESVVSELRAAGLRAETDLRNEKINYKVREHSVAKVPVLLAVGHREVDEKTVAMRRLGSKQQQVLALHEAVESLSAEVRNRR